MENKKTRIVIVGRAGSGKTFFSEYLRERGHRPQISVTTRPMRTGERHMVDYQFVTESLFNKWKRAGKFWEAKDFNGWKYGTLASEWREADSFIFTPSGVADIPLCERDDCFIIYFDIPLSVRKRRLMQRSDVDAVERRIAADNKDFESYTDYDMVIENSKYDCEALYEQLVMLEVINETENKIRQWKEN